MTPLRLTFRHVALAASAVVALAAPVAFAQTTAAQSATALTAGWREGFVIQNDNGDFRLQIGALAHLDGRFAVGDDNEAVLNTFAIRRLRPYLRGRIANRFEFYINPEVAGSAVVLQDAYVDTRFSRAFRVRIGKAKTPFGLERLQSASSILFFERALPTALVPNRDIGVQVLGDLRGGVVSYLAGVLNGVPDGGSADVDTNDGKDVAGRLQVKPFATAKGAHPLKGLAVAIAGSTGKQAGATQLPSIRTSSLLQTFLSYNGSLADGTRTRYSPQVAYYYKGFGALGEFVHTELPIRKGNVRETIEHDAWQIAGSLLLTGEAASDGAVRPKADFDFGNGHLGAFQIGARYHALEADLEAISLGLAASGSSRKAEASSSVHSSISSSSF